MVSANYAQYWDDIERLRTGCYPHLLDVFPNIYHYRPSLGAGITFCVLFAFCSLGHLVTFGFFRKWTSILFFLGSITELIGWAGRTWSAKCPYNTNAFLMQITTLIIAPTFYAAALYVLLGSLIKLLGPQTSIMTPKWYAIIFCTCDVASLVIQAVGGAMASTAADKIDGDTKPGTHTMVAGIVFQLFTMTVFAVLVADFLRRVFVHKTMMDRKIKLVLSSMTVSFVMIYIRSIYRTIELAEGWSGKLITTEGYFIGLDAALMFVAAAAWLVFDPAVLLRSHPPRTEPEKDDSEFSS
ncbi:RTA1 like protein-domain-containing protein [Podospora australis]|uniref:RTA1 like protein-domain-containing protein n=1 Tax=Podospora australis TaxID=1536484 RepID=A0AAN7APQ9_9PEZI|nr:RTA1 like protein-domain-containing protein [Podospora australis]